MRPRKILCPVDFSSCSTVAFEHAVALARFSHSALIVVHVTLPPPTFVSGHAGFGAMSSYEPESDPRLEEIQLCDVDGFTRVHLVGLEGESIVDYAEQSRCDLIVMGTHGYGGIAKILVGSVADYVLRYAQCPVVIIRNRQPEAAEDFKKATTALE